MLREVEGLSTPETAECLDVAEPTVKTRVHRARALLRRELEERFGESSAAAFRFGAERCDRLVATVMAVVIAPSERTASAATAPRS